MNLIKNPVLNRPKLKIPKLITKFKFYLLLLYLPLFFFNCNRDAVNKSKSVTETKKKSIEKNHTFEKIKIVVF